MSIPTTEPTTYRCFGCDRTTTNEGLLIVHEVTGKLYCSECLTFEAENHVAHISKSGGAWRIWCPCGYRRYGIESRVLADRFRHAHQTVGFIR